MPRGPQAVSNLIENALKYTPAGGQVEVRAQRRQDGRIEIAVLDDGPGIPPADRDGVLERYVRLESARSTPGAGLGLSLNGRSLSQGTLRGGPSLRQAAGTNVWFNVQTDNRRKVRLSFNASGSQRANGDSEFWSVRPQLNIVPSAAMTLSLGPMFSANHSVLQYIETTVYGAESRYIFGKIDQTTSPRRSSSFNNQEAEGGKFDFSELLQTSSAS